MDGFLRLTYSFFSCRNFNVVLAILWVGGLLSGTLTTLLFGPLLAPLIISALNCGLTFFSLLTALLLPLLLTFFAVYSSQRWLIFIIVFLKAFLFSYVWVSILAAFQSSGWLLCAILMFGASLALPFLWWIWLRVDCLNRQSFVISCLYTAIGIVLVACINYEFVAPFGARLIYF